MAGHQAFGSKRVACLLGLVFLVALTMDAAGTELTKKNLTCLADCGTKEVQCSISCGFKGFQAIQCLEACGALNLSCMGNCTGVKENLNLGLELKSTDQGN
ncbi:unnamed protein product [Rhodiola kirilowii]